MSIRALCLIFSLMFFQNAVVAGDLKSMSMREERGIVSIQLNGTAPLAFKKFILPNPERVVIDLTQINLKTNLQQQFASNSLIAKMRVGKPGPDSLRLVFDMKKTVTIKTIRSGLGLRVDFIPESGKSISIKHVPNKYANSAPAKVNYAPTPHVYTGQFTPNPHSNPQGVKIPVKVRHSPGKNHRDVVIVLDPGHGGKDPGAIGPSRNPEKNITLSIASRLKSIIDSQPGMRAVLTRKGDYYVGLRERLDIARKYNADIFISIHADAFINQHSSGASVFALSQTGATSEAARWLAEKENYSELGGVNLSDLDDKLVRTVLIDLSQTATIGASLQMGNNVLRHLDQITNLHNNKVEQARFVVLKSPDIPSILIETGFITNPREERNLTSAAYQNKLTHAILQGLKQYFWEHPPQGTRIEAMSSTKF